MRSTIAADTLIHGQRENLKGEHLQNQSLLVLLVLRDGPEEVGVLALGPGVLRDGPLRAVRHDHRAEVRGDAGDGLDRVGAGGAQDAHGRLEGEEG